MSQQQDYTVSELAEIADVTIRTIRYYVAEELLPPPEGSGRAATYNQEHLARLELIKILKEEFLPLQEIRALLSGLDYRAVVELLEEKQQSEAPPPPAPNSAKEYLQTLLQRPTRTSQQTSLMRHKVAAHQQRQALSEPSRARPLLPDNLKATPAPAPHPPEPDQVVSHWRRIRLAPEVELHLKAGVEQTPLWPKIEQIIQLARQILTG